MTLGGDSASSLGENNGMAKLTEKEVLDIRKRLEACQESTLEIWRDYSDKVTRLSFLEIYNGHRWSHIMSGWQTPERLEWHAKHKQKKLSDKDIINIRIKKKLGYKRIEVEKEYPEVTSNTFKAIWFSQTRKNITDDIIREEMEKRGLLDENKFN